MTSTASKIKVRAINTGPKSKPAQARMELYGNAMLSIKNAIENRYPLEAIALLESLMADRLEARLACIHKQDINKRNFSTLGRLIQELCGSKSLESEESKEVYRCVQKWAELRNVSIHQMVKLAEGDSKDWKARLKEAQAAAEEGLSLFNKLAASVKKLNKPPKLTDTTI